VALTHKLFNSPSLIQIFNKHSLLHKRTKANEAYWIHRDGRRSEIAQSVTKLRRVKDEMQQFVVSV